MTKQLRDKLNDFAPDPPSGSWDRIEDSLEPESLSRLAERFRQYNVSPPERTWDDIESELESAVPIRATPIYRRFRKRSLISSAAVLLVVASVSIPFYLSNNNHSAPKTVPAFEQQSITPRLLPKLPLHHSEKDSSGTKSSPPAPTHKK